MKNKTLNDIVIGDKLILKEYGKISEVIVTSKTKTMITIGEYPKGTLAIDKDRFRIKDGYRVGADSIDGTSGWDKLSLIK